MRKLGSRELTLHLAAPLGALPEALHGWPLKLAAGGTELQYSLDADEQRNDVPALLQRLAELGIGFKDLNTRQSSLEEIFVSLVSERRQGSAAAPGARTTRVPA
jgi:ABC-2 type transport system ATP-binding protein